MDIQYDGSIPIEEFILKHESTIFKTGDNFLISEYTIHKLSNQEHYLLIMFLEIKGILRPPTAHSIICYNMGASVKTLLTGN